MGDDRGRKEGSSDGSEKGKEDGSDTERTPPGRDNDNDMGDDSGRDYDGDDFAVSSDTPHSWPPHTSEKTVAGEIIMDGRSHLRSNQLERDSQHDVPASASAKSPEGKPIRPVPRPSAFSWYRKVGANMSFVEPGSPSVSLSSHGDGGALNPTTVSSFMPPFWNWSMPEAPSNCGRGCCPPQPSGRPAETSISPKGPLMGPDYVEFGEDGFAAVAPTVATMQANFATLNYTSATSQLLSSAIHAAVAEIVVPMLQGQVKQVTESFLAVEKDCRSSSRLDMGLMREIVAQEISRYTSMRVPEPSSK